LCSVWQTKCGTEKREAKKKKVDRWEKCRTKKKRKKAYDAMHARREFKKIIGEQEEEKDDRRQTYGMSYEKKKNARACVLLFSYSLCSPSFFLHRQEK